MAEESRCIPNILLQPPSVDFIQRRLPEIHPTFEGFESLQYDSTSNRFVSTKPDMLLIQKPKAEVLAGQRSTISVRQLVPAISAMEFWNKILSRAMAEFIAENTVVPKTLAAKPQYAIRGLTSWVEIHKRFQGAKEVYNGNNSNLSRITKRIYRYVADNSGVLKIITAIIPDGTYVTPVKTALEGIIDIVQIAANFRKLVRASFEEVAVEKSFAKVEIYLATFPGDENIERASVSLIACILKAIELAITFLLSSTASRTFQSLNIRGEYMQELADSISDIPQKTQDVIDTANDSNIIGTHKAMSLSLEAIEELLLLEAETGKQTKIIATKADLIIEKEGKLILELDGLKVNFQLQLQQHTAALKQEIGDNKVDLGNIIRELMGEYEKSQDTKYAKIAKIAQEVQAQLESFTGTITSTITEQIWALRLEASRPATPVLLQQHPSAWPLPPPPPTQYTPHWLSASPQTAWQQWGMPGSYNYSQPEHSGSQYPTSQWRTPIHLAVPTISVDELLEALNISDIDNKDFRTILDSSESVPLPYRLRARAILRTDEFQCWATALESRELLIQRDRLQDPIQTCNAVSLVAASLIQTLRSRDRYVSLVFFCRRHIDSDDTCAYTGPAAMIRSFVTQLLEQSYQGYSFVCGEVDLEGIRAGNVVVLCTLLEWLVKYLPEKEKKKTLVCIADGIDAYENGEDGDDLRTVMDLLLGLARSEDPDRIVKLLATSPMGTVSIDEAFRNDPSSFLSIERLQIVSYEEGAFEFEEKAREL